MRRTYVIGVHRNGPYFQQLRAPWKQRYPSQRTPPTVEAEGLKVIADFATQFPGDCKSP